MGMNWMDMILKLRNAYPLHSRLALWVVLVFSLSMVGCSSRATSAPPTSTSQPTVTQIAKSTPTPEPTDTPRPTPAPLSLTIVHTNDTWGYLDPCG